MKLCFPLNPSRHVTVISADTPTLTSNDEAKDARTTWMHARRKQWPLIDYAICRRRDIHDVTITRAMQGTECWTDHRLVRSVLSLNITPTRRKTAKSCRPAFDTAELKQLERSPMFAKDLDDRLTAHGPLSGPPPQQWEQFKTLVTESAKLTIGPKKKVHQDWFDENDERIKELLDDKKKPSSRGRISPPLQKAGQGPGGTWQNAGRVVGEEGRRSGNLCCHKELKNDLQRHQGSLPPYQATHHAAPVS